VAAPRLRSSAPTHAQPAPKKADGGWGQDEQALVHTRGGFGNKIHGAVNGLGLPVKLALPPGQAADVGQAENLIAGAPFEVVTAPISTGPEPVATSRVFGGNTRGEG